ncbi:MAG: hypothetical protein R3222_07330, partial [Balneolaceae bacterium]|nr:hypothetical protein [Balneolaceae bacterium]
RESYFIQQFIFLPKFTPLLVNPTAFFFWIFLASLFQHKFNTRLGLEETATLQTVSNKRYTKVTRESAGLQI